ncbi:hypothetical protein QYS62_004615 [Fusarium acuminatum]|uniref:Uncharacterized protein n=1 Tax=Fusarium acuminatum TaxID=5515 RepID=A0ABZ2WS75_9HYPO
MSEDPSSKVEPDPQDEKQTSSVHEASSEGSGSESREAKTPSSEKEDNDLTGETEPETKTETEMNRPPRADESQTGEEEEEEESEPTPPEKEQEQRLTSEPTHEMYLGYRKARLEHDQQWWGEHHLEPPLNHPDRQLMWSRNDPISDEEFKDAVKGYNEHIINPETGEADPFGVHLRSSTPPMERARKQIQRLKDDGQDVPTALVKEIFHHYTLNSGTFPALMEWSRDEKTIPVELANEFVKMIDRLKLEMASQLRDVNKKLGDSNKEKDEAKTLNDKQNKFLETRDLEVARLEKELRGGEKISHTRRKSDVENQSISSQAPLLLEIRQLRNENSQAKKESSEKELDYKKDIAVLKEQLHMAEVETGILKARLDSGKYASPTVFDNGIDAKAESQAANNELSEQVEFLKSQVEVGQRCLEAAEKECEILQEECKIERQGREELKQEVEKYKYFHQEIYKQLDKHARTWARTWALTNKETADSVPKEDEEALEPALLMIREASKHWDQLKRNYETDWPPNKESMDRGKLGRDWIVLMALKISADELEANIERNFRLRDRLNQQLKENENEKVELEKAHKALVQVSSPHKEFSEYYAVPPVTSFQLPRTPVAVGGNSLEQGILSPASTKGWLDGEIKRLEQIKFNLDKAIAEKDEKMKQLERDIDDNGGPQAEVMTLQDQNSTLVKDILDKDNEIKSLKRELQACKDVEEANNKPEGSAKKEEKSPKSDKDRTEELEARLKTQQEEVETSNNLKKQLQELRERISTLESEVIINQDAVTAMERVNYTTADSLVHAVAIRPDGSNSVDRLSLMDRINYLNLLCFFRTRNYIQLALRQGANTLADIMLIDAMNWVEFCNEDFKRMDPSVSGQIIASMRILHGVRRIFTAKDQENLDKGRRHVRAGHIKLEKFEHSAAFEQFMKLAEAIIRTTQDTDGNPLYGRTLRFRAHTGLRLERRMNIEKARKVLKRDGVMKAGALRTGFHSPLSPENWRDDPDAGFESEETNV